jgi:hypothetical protein
VLFGIRPVPESRTPTGSFSHLPDLSARVPRSRDFAD